MAQIDCEVVHTRACLRITVRLYALIAAATLLLPITAIAGGIELDSREYKMMLKPEEFTGVEAQQAVERFAREQLVPAVRTQWSGNAADELVAKGLKVDERRIVRFLDSRDCLLYRHGFAWRKRVDTGEHGTRAEEVELTLKFRSPDAFLAAGMPLKAKEDARQADSKFEEDLGPVAVRDGPQRGVAANPRSARSQFSRSTKQLVSGDKLPTSLAGISGLYRSFEDQLQTAAGHVQMSAPLEPSPEYREVVYESSKLDLIKDFKARFALTLWYKDADNQDQPALAEISFKYETRNGEVPNEAARRALALLLTIQDLPWANPTAPTKTAFVACDAAS
jgi:hypothetical protein